MIKVYDLNMQLVAYLDNAFAIGYEQRMNELWTASFAMPQDDPKNDECLPLRFVELFDAEERIDLFRIIPTNTQRSITNQTISYECEHVLATLADDVLFQYHQFGGFGITTTQSLQYVLNAQETEKWQLGTIDFNYQFEYKIENENLLGSLFAIPKPFLNAYHWTWDTSSYPWTLNLVQSESEEPSCYIRYGKNLQGITKVEDPTYLVTRLYMLGYGEGVNQLTIKDVNSGLPYVDSDTQGQYGIISSIYTDKTMENANTLKSKGQALLDASKLPRITYTVDAADISQLTGDSLDKFVEGALVRVIDEELGIDIISRVVVSDKSDIIATPWAGKLQIANKTADIVGSIAELENRQRISEVYAQGATNLDSHDFTDNADATHPAIIRFYLPAETVRINKMMLSYETSNFRAYERSIAAAPAVTSGPSSVTTTESDDFDDSVGYLTGEQPSTVNTDYDGDHWHTTDPVDETTSINGEHVHIVDLHQHRQTLIPHTHDMPHTHEIPEHTHEIEYGIFLRSPLPTAIVLTVDGNAVPVTATSGENIDIIPYLALDGSGKITRDTWHEIKITPNDLGRITANVVTQLFVQSRGAETINFQ